MAQPRYHVEPLRSGRASEEAPVGAGEGARAASVGAATLRDVFRAPWRAVSLLALEPGAALGPRALEASEAMVYVTAGAGTAHLLHGPVELREGIALTLFAGELLHLEAGAGAAGLELFFAEIGTGRQAAA